METGVRWQRNEKRKRMKKTEAERESGDTNRGTERQTETEWHKERDTAIYIEGEKDRV